MEFFKCSHKAPGKLEFQTIPMGRDTKDLAWRNHALREQRWSMWPANEQSIKGHATDRRARTLAMPEIRATE